MNERQSEETELAARFLRETGRTEVALEASDKPDVIAVISGRRIGIEVTQFHGDEQAGVKGSAHRRQEARRAKESNARPYTMAIPTNPLPGLVARINAKISVAAAYDHSRYKELWLLVSGQVPKPGAPAATFAFPLFVNVEELNRLTHDQLCESPFSAAHFHLMMNHALFSWSRSEGWHEASALQS